jgi:hypothetical protein
MATNNREILITLFESANGIPILSLKMREIPVIPPATI